MAAAAVTIVFACLLRQVDRVWYTFWRPRRPRQRPRLADVVRWQRKRANNFTPTLVVVGHWLELLGWCVLLGGRGAVGGLVLVLVTAVKFRQLQEVTHFAVHGVLAGSRYWGDILAEVFFQAPLLLSRVESRRRTHVREHHPNATVRPVDPNLKTLADAGIRTGSSRMRALSGLVFPLTPRGLAGTLRELAANATPLRLALPLAFGGMCFAVAGWPGLVSGFVVPRLVVYPLLAWMSLLVEHRWLDAEPRTGTPLEVEAGRCYRLYPRRPLLLLLARATWLPFGDAFHYAHSVHPAVRWNYLPLVDRMLAGGVAERQALLIGKNSVLGTLYREAAYGA